jgi:hypothetical protein
MMTDAQPREFAFVRQYYHCTKGSAVVLPEHGRFCIRYDQLLNAKRASQMSMRVE